MPGASRLTKELGVGRDTVEAALRQLEEEGLLINQGGRRRRRIALPEGHSPPALRVAMLMFNVSARSEDFNIELRHLLEEAGHIPFFPEKTLHDLGMNVDRVARFVEKTEADAWMVNAASRDILEWFATEQKTPAFALFGRRSGLPMAGAGPNKAPLFGTMTRRLIELGHRRISLLCRRQLRLPHPAQSLRSFLSELEAGGIQTGNFNLPDWEESKAGFGKALNSLFEHTPPTALILDEPFLYHAAYHHLARRRLRVPEDVSLICTDGDPGFAWCEPAVSHISWERGPVVRRIVRWANTIAHGKQDKRQTLTAARFVEGGTIGPVGGS